MTEILLDFEIVNNESDKECQKCGAIPYFFWINSNGKKICPNCKIREMGDVE